VEKKFFFGQNKRNGGKIQKTGEKVSQILIVMA
jgi:hypothetical protein